MNMEFMPIRTLGRAPVPVSGTVLRELEEADLVALATEKGSKPSALKRLSQRHHALARCIARGDTPGDAAMTCGYVPSRVSILQADPAFQELVAFYASMVEAEFRGVHEKLAGVSEAALDEIENRLEDSAEDVPLGHLMELVKLGADRTGFGPQSSTTNVNINVGNANALKLARERVQQRRLAAIEGTAVRVGE